MIGIQENIVVNILDKANNGQEALDIVKEKLEMVNGYSYGIIFMDCSMPILDGYKASLEIKKFYRTQNIELPKIIALTGHTEDVYIQKAFQSEMDEVVPKPANV
jgi:CheY-like chemotaxis protein